MKIIFEEYGSVILQIIGGLVVLLILLDMLHPGGNLNELIKNLAESAC